jgi:hypothetical protein
LISFFANPSGSGEIRGRQMAEHLGAKLNPTAGFEDDVCVWVKRKPPEDNLPARTYLDIVDGSERIRWLERHPAVPVIASSLSGSRFLQRMLPGRKVVLIPQHHCNFDRLQRVVLDWSKPRLGVVGGAASMPIDVAERIGARRYLARSRTDVVEAYLQIDIQVIWRGEPTREPWGPMTTWRPRERPLKNALKIINAASFGIPTVAIPEIGYLEMEGYYSHARTVAELLKVIELWAEGYDGQRLINKAEEYHIENIANRYPEL